MLEELKKELANLDEVNFAIKLMRANRLTEGEGAELESNIIGYYTYCMSQDTVLSAKEADFMEEMLRKEDENGKKYPKNKIEIMWDATDEGKTRYKIANLIKVLQEQLKSVRNYNFYLRSEKKI